MNVKKMPRDMVSSCKKRHHPDGFHLSTSSPKRLLSISEAQLDSSIDSANNSTMVHQECMLDSGIRSMWNSASAASAAITSNCSIDICATHSTMSTMSTDIVSSKPPLISFTQSHSPSDAASHCTKASISARSSLIESSYERFQMHCLTASKGKGTASGSEHSEVTYPHASEPEGVSFSGKATHIISRREKSSLNNKWGMDEASVKDAFGSDTILQEKRLVRNSSWHSTSQRRGVIFSSMTGESGSSCAIGDSCTGEIWPNQGFTRIVGSACMDSTAAFPSVPTKGDGGPRAQEQNGGFAYVNTRRLEEIRPMQGLSHIYGSSYKESFPASSNTHARPEGWIGSRGQEIRGGLEHFNTQQHSDVEMGLPSSFLHKEEMEELSPSYVLSSGRLSLEEEARLGRRAPTIDRDFEEYFSALMLE